jgi:hypothetical protein
MGYNSIFHFLQILHNSPFNFSYNLLFLKSRLYSIDCNSAERLFFLKNSRLYHKE